MNRNIAVGVDIGTYSINTVVLELDKKAKSPKILALNSSPSSGLRKGVIVDIKEAGQAIKASVRQAEKTAGISVPGIYVSIGGLNLSSVISKGLVAISRADGEITDYDVKRVIEVSESNLPRMANKKVLHAVPLMYKIDNEPIGKYPIGMKGGKLEVETMFVATFSQNLNNLVKSVELAGLKIEDIIASPIASSRVLLNKHQREVGAFIFDLGAATASLAVFEEGIPISVNILPFGSGNITNDIALVLQISLDESEKLKHIFGSGQEDIDRQTNKKLSDIIEARLNDIFELTADHLRKIGREKLLPGGVVLTGGGSNLANISVFAKNFLKIPAEIGICRDFETKEKRFFDGKWPVALGLAMLGLDEAPDIHLGFELAAKTKNFLSRWVKTFLP